MAIFHLDFIGTLIRLARICVWDFLCGLLIYAFAQSFDFIDPISQDVSELDWEFASAQNLFLDGRKLEKGHSR
jgi:hypothetical protein